MASSSNSNQYLSAALPGNRSSSAPPLSTSIRIPKNSQSSTRVSQNQTLRIHPILEAQTNSFNESLAASENTTEMSNYSSSSSEYSYPASTNGALYGSNSTPISQTEVNQMLHTLRSHRVNTLTELRRIEKVLSSLNALEYYAPMTEAWNHYVASNNFLSELRGLTRQYPFSTELLENAKWRVYNDPGSNKSWNFAWLLLTKLRNDQMVSEYATKTAYEPAMWGGATPDAASATQLATVLTQEWTKAVDRMLRHWSTPPTTDGFY